MNLVFLAVPWSLAAAHMKDSKVMFLAFGPCRLRLSALVSVDLGFLDSVQDVVCGRSYTSVLYSALPLTHTATTNVITPSQLAASVVPPPSAKHLGWLGWLTPNTSSGDPACDLSSPGWLTPTHLLPR